MDGQDIIDAIVKSLEQRGVRCHDSEIVRELAAMTMHDIRRIIESK